MRSDGFLFMSPAYGPDREGYQKPRYHHQQSLLKIFKSILWCWNFWCGSSLDSKLFNRNSGQLGLWDFSIFFNFFRDFFNWFGDLKIIRAYLRKINKPLVKFIEIFICNKVLSFLDGFQVLWSWWLCFCCRVLIFSQLWRRKKSAMPSKRLRVGLIKAL